MTPTGRSRTHRTRLSAEDRRAAVVHAGLEEFAARGLSGASTEAIAALAEVSQPYVFQLFGTKRDLFIAVVRHGFERTRIAFEDAADRFDRGEETGCHSPIAAMGIAYIRLLADRTLLLVQLQGYAACSDPVVREAVRSEFAALHRFVASRTGATSEEIHHFFAEGMLLNVGAAVQLDGDPFAWTLDQLHGAGGAD